MTPTLTTRRIVALIFIAVTIAGLAVAQPGRAPDPVSVPPGAHAGQLDLHSCTYEAEHATLPADCGTLVVPENRHDANSRLIAVPVTRIKASTDNPAEPVFRLKGGPGLSNMEFPEAGRFVADRDVVLVGYRGVDGSSRLDCPEISSVLKTTDILSADMKGAIRACSERLQDDGVDLAGYTIPQRIEDFEAARRALGYDKIDLVSESFGTRVALDYSLRHPSSIHRSVMTGVNPPGHFVYDAAVTDAQMDKYAELCDADEDCRSRTGDLSASMRRVFEDMPDHWGPFPIRKGNVRAGTFFGMANATDATAPLTAPMMIDSWLSAQDGDASGLWLTSALANLVFPDTQVWGDVAAMGRADAHAVKAYFAAGHDKDPNVASAATSFLFSDGDIIDAWPSNADDDAYSRFGRSDTETLMIAGDLDFATPPQSMRELMPKLRNGHMVQLEGLGHSEDVWSEQVPASTRLITAFLDSGRVDTSLYRPGKVDLDPSSTHGSLAFKLVGTMIVVPVLLALVLAGVIRRGRRRGSMRPWSSVIVRSVFAAIFGLAGWMFAVLVVLVTSARIAMDDQSLVMVAMAIPVAAATYYGWLDRSRPSRTRRIGLAAAVTGAVLGAWLGYAAGADLAALLTASVGAVAGSNLALVARDVWAGDEVPPRSLSPDHGALHDVRPARQKVVA